MRLLKEAEMEPEEIVFTPENLAELIRLINEGKINRTVAKEVFEHVFKENINPTVYVSLHVLSMVNDEGALRSVIEEVIAANPASVADYKGGKEKAIGFLVGQTMKEMKGKADPGMINRLLKELLQ
jgi:aspartyl-tRNA(Asn)/glutamyl-tRNA(Gln) amidotransferase subunit B